MSGVEESLGRQVGRGLGWSAAGNIALRLFNVATSVAVARLVAPSEFGAFAVALTVWLVVGTIAEFGLGTDLIRARDLEARAPTVATLAIVLGVLVALGMAACAPALAAAFESPESTGVIRLLAASAVLMGFAVVPSARLYRDFRQKELFVVNAIGAVASTATVVALAATGTGAASLAWGQLVGQLVLVLGLHLATRTVPAFSFDREVAREVVALCLPLAAANVVSWLLLTLDNMVVSRQLGAVQLGFYVLAFNVSSWPMSAVGQALRSVALPGFSRLDVRERSRALVRVTGPVVALAALAAMLLATLSGPLVELLYGERWRPAAAALVGLALFGGMRVVFDMIVALLVAAGLTAEVFLVQIVWLAALVPAMVWATARHGLAGAGWSHVAVAVGVVLPAYLLCLRRAGVAAGPVLGTLPRPLLGLLPAAAVCTWIGRLDGPPLLLLAAGGIAGLLLYALPMAPWWLRTVRAPTAPSARGTTTASPTPPLSTIGHDR